MGVNNDVTQSDDWNLGYHGHGLKNTPNGMDG